MLDLTNSARAWLDANVPHLSRLGIHARLTPQTAFGENQGMGLNLDSEKIRATITVWSKGRIEIIAVKAVNGETAFTEESFVNSDVDLKSRLESWVVMIRNCLNET